MKYNTREEWLLVAVEKLRPLFKGNGHDIPKVRVTCGWPSTKGLARKKKAVGECWDAKSTEDNVAQIFISPVLKDATGATGVLGVLAHELVHAVLGCEAKHGRKFAKLADAIGLVKPWTATIADEGLCDRFDDLVGEMGEYPHSAIVPACREKKPQTTRLLKSECEECGYTVRVTQKWVDVGVPHCPLHGAMFVEQPEVTDED